MKQRCAQCRRLLNQYDRIERVEVVPRRTAGAVLLAPAVFLLHQGGCP